jgi:hypothetical protein
MTPRDLHTLHRYFLWADRMRVLFYATLAEDKARSDASGAPRDPTTDVLFVHPYMSYWYAGTFVLIEGWGELGIRDATIDRLLDSPHVDLLRRYRNGAFHFQRDYFDNRLLGFVGADESAKWIFDVRQAFSKWFLDYFEWLRAGGVADVPTGGGETCPSAR